MNGSRFSMALAALALPASKAAACSVCFGDPESPMTHGARQGVLVMLVITYALLVGLFGMLAFVIFKARRRHQINGGPPGAEGAEPAAN